MKREIPIMNQLQTIRHRELVAEITKMVTDDLEATYESHCAKAYERYQNLQKAFLEPLEDKGINTDAEKVTNGKI